MVFKNSGKASYRAKDKKLCELLNNPDVPDDVKNDLLAKGIAEVQSTWSNAERSSRCRWAHADGVEITVCHDEQFPTVGKRRLIVRDTCD